MLLFSRKVAHKVNYLFWKIEIIGNQTLPTNHENWCEYFFDLIQTASILSNKKDLVCVFSRSFKVKNIAQCRF